MKFITMALFCFAALGSLQAQEKEKGQVPGYKEPQLTVEQKAELQKLADERARNASLNRQVSPVNNASDNQGRQKTMTPATNRSNVQKATTRTNTAKTNTPTKGNTASTAVGSRPAPAPAAKKTADGREPLGARQPHPTAAPGTVLERAEPANPAKK